MKNWRCYHKEPFLLQQAAYYVKQVQLKKEMLINDYALDDKFTIRKNEKN